MDFANLKKAARSLGIYRPARWVNRHFFNRKELERERGDFDFYAQLKLIRKGDLVFDVGANYGEKSRIFLQLGAKVIAFEPQPDCREELKWRCGKASNLTVVETALGAESGEATLYVRESRGSSGFVRNWVTSKIEKELIVPVGTLDRAIEEYGVPSYIKIDVEGFEYQVLKGLSQPVSCISFEFHLMDIHHGRNSEDVEKVLKCVEHLSSLGEVLVNITPAERLVFGFNEWLTKDDFIDFFATLDVERFRKLFEAVERPKSYGDIFVKIRP